MAAPVDSARQTYDGSTSTTTHAVTLPGGIAAGDVLVMVVRTPTQIASFTWPAGWTKLDPLGDRGADVSDDFQQAAWRLCDGTEGATVTVTLDTAAHLAAITWLVTGGDTADLSLIATGTSANPNSPSFNPFGGTIDPHDVLWLTVGGIEGARTITTAPTGYSNATIIANTGATGDGQCSVYGASLGETSVSSEDPPAWTLSASDNWMAWTVAVFTAQTKAVVSQIPVEALVQPDTGRARISQLPVEVVVEPDTMQARISQMVVEVIVQTPTAQPSLQAIIFN